VMIPRASWQNGYMTLIHAEMNNMFRLMFQDGC
jgi:hypothetical protein